MAKSNNLKELFEYSKKQDPFSVFQTQFGFLKLSEEQKVLVQEKVFSPGKHIFAHISEDSNGIKCVEVSAKHPSTFETFVKKHEVKSLAYAYLGESNNKGKISFEQ